ncbi:MULTISPECIES: glutathione S-transferase family protein [Calothrix]|uniref:glutathione transferase n=2 Tax=Calothrix TaxID=1186 RepID=A0ABR8A6B3_9CYAN|nr:MULTISPECIES: glutathione S-transferase family protein [Calothrix]MBD2195537.1 glutathione S-transferase family protein [Calothrix parietina FACHB-288]MBD2224138.1 glutathione S-transferase family protein [Calothrix anomala FACHB-343]
MLKLYHQPISFNSRRPWIALLEKGLDFELIEMQLNGDQFQPEFVALNPFHHVPVLVDDDFRVVESLAILDYIEAKYPNPSLLPKEEKALAIVRMVEMVTVNELLPAINPLLRQMIGLDSEPEKIEEAKQKAAVVLNFFEQLLGDRPYFGSEQLTLADIVAGTSILFLPQMGVTFNSKLQSWSDRITQRPSWQTTQPTPKAIAAFKSRIKTLMAKNQAK